MGLSAATIRNEMQKLTDMGYLYQPHTSAGRVPADKGYRYLVDRLISEKAEDLIKAEILDEIEKAKKARDSFTFLQEISRTLSSFSSGLVFLHLPGEGICLREGWVRVFRDPEFSDIKYARKFLLMLDLFEKNIDNFEVNDFSVKVYIGSEAPIPRSRDFSIVMSKCSLRKNETVLAILGPKRMSYSKNIPLINSIVTILRENGL